MGSSLGDLFSFRGGNRRRGRSWWAKRGLLAVALGAAFAAIVVLSVEVVRKIEALATANSDNVQWTLSQIEVEFLRFETAVLQASIGEPPDLDAVRRRFDIFYSRIETLRTSPVYSGLRGEAEFANALASVRELLDRTVPLIDGPDAALVANLARIEAAAEAEREIVRSLALRGIRSFAEMSDRGRVSVSSTLISLGAVSLALVLALLALLGVVLAMYRRGQARANEIHATSARLRAIVSTSLDAILVVDRQGMVLDYNGAAEATFGYSRREVIGKRMADLVVPEHFRAAHEAGMDRYRKTGEKHVVGAGRVQLEAMRKTGEVFPVEMSIDSAEGAAGEIFVSFLRDISSRKAAEQALMKARDEALAGEKAKAELLAVMSHEMRTPLNGLLGTMELLEHTEMTQEQRDYVDIMATSGDILLHHVNDVLDISRLDSGADSVSRSVFDFRQLVQEVVDGLAGVARAGGNTLHAKCLTECLDAVSGDRRKLRQVLLNLVGNAVKFTRDGEIAVEVERLSGTDQVEIRVTDTGLGIALSDQARVFEDFVTLDTSFGRETGGTGLGLAISRRLVDAMAGEIGLESEPGEGSLFWVRLPLPIAERRAAKRKKRSAARTETSQVGAGRRVLVVEDNRINRQVVRGMLERLGCTVVEANDGVEGVRIAARQRFDLILMDISMPRMDGVAATTAIRNGDGASADVRIVPLTAHALPDDLLRFRDAGMDQALVKPLTIAALRALLDVDRTSATSTEASTSSTGIENGQLEELLQQLGPERANTAIKEFVDEADAALDALAAASAVNLDLAATAAQVHKLAGSAAVFGARDLHEKLAAAETAATSGDRAQLATQLDAALSAWVQVRRTLLARLEASWKS